MKIALNEYARVHQWLVRNYGKATGCDFDNTHINRVYHWANISGEYVKDINHYRQLCASCHRALDVKLRSTCRKGHEYTEENTRWHRLGYRICRQCNMDYARDYYLNRKVLA